MSEDPKVIRKEFRLLNRNVVALVDCSKLLQGTEDAEKLAIRVGQVNVALVEMNRLISQHSLSWCKKSPVVTSSSRAVGEMHYEYECSHRRSSRDAAPYLGSSLCPRN